MTSKRFLALFLVLCTLGSLMTPATVQAAEDPQTTLDSSNMAFTGTNSFGNLLAAEISTHQLQEETAEAGFSVTELSFSGSTATVTYSALREAILVVAVYTEDGLQLLCSGKATVSPDETTATVTVQGNMPEYFYAGAYLLDATDYVPLCEEYTTPMYTREMRELLASTVDSYDPEKVYNLDDDRTTNFAVFAEDTIVIDAQPGMNTVTSVDDTNKVYVIENADETITSLQPGDILAYPYGENEILIVKVASLSVSGTTATITGTDVEIEEVFDAVKIESNSNTADFVVDDTGAAEEVTYLGLVAARESRSGDGGITTTYEHKFEIKKEKWEEKSDDEDIELKLDVTFSLKLTAGVEYYLKGERSYLEFFAAPTIILHAELAGKITDKYPLGEFAVSPMTGLYIICKPQFEVEFSGNLTFDTTWTSKIGFACDGKTVRNISTDPVFSDKLDIRCTIFVGFDLNPTVRILSEHVAEASVSALVGFEVTVRETGFSGEIITANPTSYHNCSACLAIDVAFRAKISGSVTFFKSAKLTVTIAIGDWRVPIVEMYHSIDHDEFGFGACPRIFFKTTIVVLDKNSNPVEGTEVILFDGPAEPTDKNGTAQFYLSKGTYYANVFFENTTVTMAIEVKNSSQKVIISEADHTRKPGGIPGDVDSETIEDSTNAVVPDVYLEDLTIINSGRYTGNQGDSFIDALGTRNGTTDIHGNEMQHGLEAWIARWNFSAESSWAWVEYDLNNSYSKLVGKLSIVADSYNCTDFNSTIEIIGDGIVLYHSLLHPGMDVTPLSVDVTDVGTLRIYVYDNSEAYGGTSFALWDFGLMKADKGGTESGGERTISIGDYIELGTYNNQPILWRCVAIDENGPLMLSDEILCFKSFDAKGEYENYYRDKEGTNNWNDSALRHWLNSSGIVDWSNHISVPSESNVFNGFNAYDHELGFLSSFTEDELVAIKQITQETYINGLDKDRADGGTEEFDPGNGSFSSILDNIAEKTENGYFQFSTDWIFILDLAQAEQVYNNLGAGYLIAQATSTAVEKDESNGSQVDTPQRYWLRVAENTGMSYENLVIVESTENISFMSALSIRNGNTFFSVGVRPAFYLNTDADFTIISNGDQPGVSDTGTYNGHVYGIIHEVMSWSDAEDYCEQLGGYLATITSAEEQAFIESLNQKGEKLWIGGYQNDSGDWCWVTGEAWDYTNWGSGEPNDYGLVGPDENNLAIWPKQWNDLNNSNTIEQVGFVYELEPIATSTEESFTTSFTDDLAIDRQPTEDISPDAIYGGDYSTEVTNTYTLKTASFTGLVPGEEYVMLALVSTEAADILAYNNLLAILQGTAASDGTLKFQYVQQVNTDTSYVVACGASNKNLKDAVITFPEMKANESLQVVNPTVVYNGVTLTEGVDYEITGAVSFTDPGTYTCIIRGIRNYAGAVECTYIVNGGAPLGDVNGDGEIDTTDAYFIVMYYNEMLDLASDQLLAADVNGDGEVDTTDAYYIVMFYNEMIDSFPAED